MYYCPKLSLTFQTFTSLNKHPLYLKLLQELPSRGDKETRLQALGYWQSQCKTQVFQVQSSQKLLQATFASLPLLLATCWGRPSEAGLLLMPMETMFKLQCCLETTGERDTTPSCTSYIGSACGQGCQCKWRFSTSSVVLWINQGCLGQKVGEPCRAWFQT